MADEDNERLHRFDQADVAPTEYMRRLTNYDERIANAKQARRRQDPVDSLACRIPVATSVRRLAPRQPDNCPHYITGRYYQHAAQFWAPQWLHRHMLLINQAGIHLECWLVPIMRAGMEQDRHIICFSGDWDGTEQRFLLADTEHPVIETRAVTLDPEEIPALELRHETGSQENPRTARLQVLDSGSNDQLRLKIFLTGSVEHDLYFRLMDGNRSRRPTASEDILRPVCRHLDRSGRFGTNLLAQELCPLPPDYLGWIRRRIVGQEGGNYESFHKHVMAAIEARGEPAAVLASRISALDRFVGKLMSASPQTFEDGEQFPGWHPQDKVLAQIWLHLCLSGAVLLVDGRRDTYLGWVATLLYRLASPPHNFTGLDIDNLSGYLGVEFPQIIRGVEKQYRYDVSIDSVGLDAGIGPGSSIPGVPSFNACFFGGTASVSLRRRLRSGTDESAWGPPESVFENYSVLLWGGSFGSSPDLLPFNFVLLIQARCESQELWQASDFIGFFNLLEAGVSIFGDDIASDAVLIIEGNQVHPPLECEVDTFSLEAGGSAEFGRIYGYIFGPRSGSGLQPHSEPPGFEARGSLQRRTHFDFGSSLLMEGSEDISGGKEFLRVLCAKQLAMLQNPTSELLISAHADACDTPERNIQLSRLRAINTLRAMHDLLQNRRNQTLLVMAHEDPWDSRIGELCEDTQQSRNSPDCLDRPNISMFRFNRRVDGAAGIQRSKPGKVELRARGEEQITADRPGEGGPDQTYRRVDITLNYLVKTSLWVGSSGERQRRRD